MILLGQGRNTLYDVDMVLANIMLRLNDVFKLMNLDVILDEDYW